MEIALTIVAILLIFLAMQRWFWVILFGLGTIASLFSMIASIIHFQILGAIGFLILALILYTVLMAIIE